MYAILQNHGLEFSSERSDVRVARVYLLDVSVVWRDAVSAHQSLDSEQVLAQRRNS